MILKYKKLDPRACEPKYATSGSACLDVTAVLDSTILVHPGSSVNIRTGLAFEVPKGYVLMLYSRSGHGFKQGLRFVNGTGIIDSDYRGEVMVGLYNDSVSSQEIKAGERIAQFMLIPVTKLNLVEAQSLEETDRGQNGFGSTGKF